MSMQNYDYFLDPGQTVFETLGEVDYIFCRFADREFDILIDNETVTMERGGEYTHDQGYFSRMTITNPDPENPVVIRLAIGTSRYRSRVITGEVTITPGLRRANGEFIADTRHDITLDMSVTDDQVKNWSENQNVVTKSAGDVGFDLNWSTPFADDNYVYHMNPNTGTNNFYVLDPHTLDVVATANVDFTADGIASFRQGIIEGGRLYACVKGKGYNWQGPAGDDYGWWGIVSWPISAGGLGAITVHADGYANNTTILASVIFNRERGTWLVQRDDEMVEVSTLSKSAIDAAQPVMTESPLTYGDSWVLYAPDYEEIFARGKYFDSNTLELKGTRTLTNDSQDQAYGYSPTTGLYYTKDSPNFIANSYESGNKWAGAAHISAQCQGARGVRKKGTVLRLPLSYDPGEFGATMNGPVIQAALTAYLGQTPPDDYLDHVYKLVIEDGFSQPRVVMTGSETFKRAKVADNFTVKTPVRLTLTIDNQLFNGD